MTLPLSLSIRTTVALCLFQAVLAIGHTIAQIPEESALAKIAELNALIDAAESAGIDTWKERATVRTAEVFLEFANWDDVNQSINEHYFDHIDHMYPQTAAELAALLPDYERNEVAGMLDDAIAHLTLLKDGKLFREPTPDIDWSSASHEGDQITFNNRPVFLADYTWKPRIPKLTEYHGDEDGFFIMPPHVVNENGDINQTVIDDLATKDNGSMGFIFLNHKNSPQWAKDKYGPNFAIREDTFTAYDIDNPGAREMYSMLLAGTVPYMVGKKYSELGYMLCNEPHFYTTKDVWATGPVSEYTIEKFRVWLRSVHGSIEDLNALWGVSFDDFDAVEIEIPIAGELRGTPIWYDWARFNNARVLDWYTFLKDEIRTYDPAAKTHLKIMPSLWVGNNRNHGIDFEALTRLSDISGNDAGATYRHLWKTEEWEDKYAFEWRELCMSYDFLKSVSPEKINFNTEAHYLSTNSSRDLYQNPAYARSSYWLAHVFGMTASQTWYWARREDGSIRDSDDGKAYGGSNNQQPRIVNEVAMTMADLNTFSEEVMAMQRQRKPIRIFYSETSAINKEEHMDEQFELYEALSFEGLSLGFATEDILADRSADEWEMILIYKTEFITDSERRSLQTYLNGGGTVIFDQESLEYNEYGAQSQPLGKGSGRLIKVNSLEEMKSHALGLLRAKGMMPPIRIVEENGIGAKGCIWRVITNPDGNKTLMLVNVARTPVVIKITDQDLPGGIALRSHIDGVRVPSRPILMPHEMIFAEILSADTDIPEDPRLSPVPEYTGGDAQYNLDVQGHAVQDCNNGADTNWITPTLDGAPELRTEGHVWNYHTELDSGSTTKLVDSMGLESNIVFKLESNVSAAIRDNTALPASDDMLRDVFTTTDDENGVQFSFSGLDQTGGTLYDFYIGHGVLWGSPWMDVEVEGLGGSQTIVVKQTNYSGGELEIGKHYTILSGLIPDQTGTVRLAVRDYQSDGTGLASFSGIQVVARSLFKTSWDSFVEQHNLSGGPLDDADEDGDPDVQEFAFRGHPQNPDVKAVWFRYWLDGGTGEMVVTNAERSEESSGVIYVTEWTDDLDRGEWKTEWTGFATFEEGQDGFREIQRSITLDLNRSIFVRQRLVID